MCFDYIFVLKKHSKLYNLNNIKIYIYIYFLIIKQKQFIVFQLILNARLFFWYITSHYFFIYFIFLVLKWFVNGEHTYNYTNHKITYPIAECSSWRIGIWERSHDSIVSVFDLTCPTSNNGSILNKCHCNRLAPWRTVNLLN